MSSVNYTTAVPPSSTTYNWYASAAPFTIPLMVSKLTTAYITTLYAPTSGNSGNVDFVSYTPTESAASDKLAATWTLVSGTYFVSTVMPSSTNLASLTGLTTATPALSSNIALHYVVDA